MRRYPGVTDTDLARWDNFSDGHRIKPGQGIRINNQL